MVSAGFGTALIFLIGLIGADAFVNSIIVQDNLHWLIVASNYFRKEIAVPLGAVTLAFLLMLQFERKPTQEVSVRIWEILVGILVAIVAIGYVNLPLLSKVVIAAIILSPVIVYFATERITRWLTQRG